MLRGLWSLRSHVHDHHLILPSPDGPDRAERASAMSGGATANDLSKERVLHVLLEAGDF